MLAAFSVMFTSQAARAQCERGNAVMNGTYVASGSGTIAGVGLIATVGEIIYNGDGTGVVVFSTANLNGATHTSSLVPITFTVNTDCTGSKPLGLDRARRT